MKISLCFALFFVKICPGFALCDYNSPPSGYRFPVVMTLPNDFLGAPVDHFSAWSFKGNIWTRIVLQVDEKNKEGSYVLENGLPFTKNTDDGLADDNDEVSFRGTDLGFFFEYSKVTPSIKASFVRFRRLDICVQDVFAGSVLIGQTKSIESRLTWNPLFNPEAQTVNTTSYKYIFNRERPMLVGRVFLKSGGSEYSVFQDSTFFMPIIPSLWMLPGMRFDESDFKSEIECWRQGPVRSIVAVGAKMNKFFSVVKLHLFSELIFYDDFFQIPTQIEMIFDADKFLDYGSGLAYVLRFPPGRNWDISTNLADLPTTSNLGGGSDGRPVMTARQSSPEGVFRAWGTRSEGSFLAQVRVDQKAIDAVPPPFMVRESMFDNPAWKKSWKWLNGNHGNLGVYLDISRVHKGIYDFALDLMLSPRANDGFTDFRPIHGEWSSLAKD